VLLLLYALLLALLPSSSRRKDESSSPLPQWDAIGRLRDELELSFDNHWIISCKRSGRSSLTCSIPRHDSLSFLSSSSAISIHTLFRALDRCSGWSRGRTSRCLDSLSPFRNDDGDDDDDDYESQISADALKKMDILPLYPRSADPVPESGIESLSAYAGARGPVQTFRTA